MSIVEAKEHKFCSKCGAETVLVSAGYFDQKTGKAVLMAQCETGQCEHDGVFHNLVAGGAFSLFSTYCRRCDARFGGD